MSDECCSSLACLRDHRLVCTHPPFAPPQVLELLMPVVSDLGTPLEVVAMAALSLGLVFSGSCHEDISQVPE